MANILGRLTLNNGVEILQTDSDPTSGGGTVAQIGSLVLSPVGTFQKTGSLATDWVEVGTGTGGSQSLAEVLSVGNFTDGYDVDFTNGSRLLSSDGNVIVEGWSFPGGMDLATIPAINAFGSLINDGNGNLYWSSNAGTLSTVYVDGDSGNDSNDGATPATAVATIDKARFLCFRNQDSTIYVLPASGPYDGTSLCQPWDRTAHLAVRADGYFDDIAGPYTLTTSTDIALNITGAPAITVDGYVNYFVEIVSSSNTALVGERKLIYKNDADTLFPIVAMSDIVPSGTVVKVVTPGVTLSVADTDYLIGGDITNALMLRGFNIQAFNTNGQYGTVHLNECIVDMPGSFPYWYIDGNNQSQFGSGGFPADVLAFLGYSDYLQAYTGAAVIGTSLDLGYISLVNNSFGCYVTGTAAAILTDGATSTGIWGARCFDSIYLSNADTIFLGGFFTPGGGNQPILIESINYPTPFDTFNASAIVGAPIEITGGNANLRIADNSTFRFTQAVTTAGALFARNNGVITMSVNMTPTGGFICGSSTPVQITRTTLVVGQSLESGDGSLICRTA